MHSSRIMILCGGRGSRLGSLTERIPKPLIRINDKTILEIKLRKYLELGFRDFVLCIGYKGSLIEKAVMGYGLDANIVFSDAGENAGMLKRIFHAKDYFADSVIITYGDTFANIDLKKLLHQHIKRGNEITITVAPIQNPFGLVEYDENYMVSSFREKPVLQYYIGYAVFKRTSMKLVTKEMIEMPNGQGLVAFFKLLIDINKLGAYYHPGLEVTFNTQEELRVAEEKIMNFYTEGQIV